MYCSTIFSLLSALTLISAQQNCPAGTPKNNAIRFAWQHRWLRCENQIEGQCPQNLAHPYSKPAKDDCEKYLSESGEDYVIDYYFCEKKNKFDELEDILKNSGWDCAISEE
ncbi:hypothetical protein CONCODRAFT_9997 [Conidiobolus coronatus NRRL 28638]|uniref:Uncharacterized protein n=1 Tax=Conidiobolus coronatus (strain ATCC 28846 / CBS 209.66 / NRRL 28638) TaxID=796925 RepID=A0A137NYB6_CONC2|nr:hypothetical protein CONCODRAFT_9997 [Conidiobolus coronatus NRRL 28638]|eukprot:KXN67863.1 hypothetical protein CONCODRAFT_9997 [Conidiobolus coronatus NRRL 28638]